jgi:hypothetical protein
MAAIAMRVAKAAASAIQAENLPFQLQHVQQFVTAALAADAVPSFEAMMAHKLPVVIDHAQARGERTAWERHLRDDAVFERVEKALRGRFGDALHSPVDLDFIKLRVAAIVLDEIRKQGLFVYSQKLLFAPEFRNTGMALLKAMKLPELPAAAASVAVATGDMPAHPTVVEFPAPKVEAGRMSRSDRMHLGPGKRPYAELGMGFFVASTRGQFPDRIGIVTPILFNRGPSDGVQQPWYAEFLTSQERLRVSGPEQTRGLIATLADIGGQSAHLNVCPSCWEIYSTDRDDLKLHCDCARTH